MREPDFENNIKQVFLKKRPARPTLFEFLISDEAEEFLSGYKLKDDSPEERIKRKIKAYYNGGYDYVPFILGDLWFTNGGVETEETYSLNQGAVITDRNSFDEYPWPDMDKVNYGTLDIVKKYLPDGMKILSYCPNGILENVIALCGYENLCFMLADDRELAERIFGEVGTRIERFITETLKDPAVGIAFCNDDWGFNSSTMLSHDDLRKLIYPYYKRLAEKTHEAGKVIGMHSCGNFSGIFSELYDVIGIDGKHSYEDSIMPVEKAYETYGGKIAVLGGIDMNFLSRKSDEEISVRCKKMLEKTEEKGGYALGSGNSIAKFVPLKNYFAMIKTVYPEFKLV